MKKLITIFSILFLCISFNSKNSYSQTGYNAVLEYCTGAWCQWCPCGEDRINEILSNYPNTVVIGYHGYTISNDPWYIYSADMLTLFGFNAYPTGVVGRKSGIIGRDGWNNEVVLQSLLIQPGVNISVTNKNYDASTRTLTATVVVTASQTLNADFYMNYVLTENNLIYPQVGNGTCPGSPTYVHEHVVKSMINGSTGELIHSGTWNTGQQVTRNLNYTLPLAPQVAVPDNCDLNIFVYKQGASISTNSDIQQSMRTSVTGVTGIQNQNSVAVNYSLSQNYPNPFNPTTNFKFSIPKDGNVSLKFYDILGNEVETYIDGFLKAGVYSVEFDGSKLSSGVYFYKLLANGFNETRKMILSK